MWRYEWQGRLQTVVVAYHSPVRSVRGCLAAEALEQVVGVACRTDSVHVNVLLVLGTRHGAAKCYTRTFTSRNARRDISVHVYLEHRY